MMVATVGGFAQLTASITGQINNFCYGTCTGSATVTGTGGVPGYTYYWSNGQTTQTITNLCDGIYDVTVTDNTSATATASVTITSPSQMTIIPTSVNSTCFGLCNGQISITVVGGVPPYTYQWIPALGIGSVAINLCSGTYSIMVTDANGCSSMTSVTITQPPLFSGTVNTIPDTCNIGHGTATATVTGGSPPYTYIWSNGANTPSITNLTQGFYYITAVESNGCIITLAGQVEDLSPSFDFGPDRTVCTGVCDTLVPISTGGTPFLTYLWSNTSTNDTMIVCPSSSSSYSLTITDISGCSFSDSIHYTLVEHCNRISGIVFEDLNNDGIKDPGENPLSNKIIMVNPGSLYATSNSNGYYEFLVDTGNFTITCINNIPYTSILPATNNAILYNAYEVDSLNNFGVYVEPHGDLHIHLTSTVMRPGFSSVYYLSYLNNGTDTSDAIVVLNMDPVPIYDGASINPTTQIGDSLAWDISGIPPGTGGTINVTITTPVATTLGTQVISYAMILPIMGDTVPSNNYSSRTNTVTGSWDPNDKAVTPSGVFPPSLVTAGDYLNYTIRFQNTGTDTAFNVHIVDTLSQNLNVSTFEMVASSHPCSFNLHGTGIVDFIFSNILLPDSNVNELGSNGYVSYKIKPKSTLVIGDEIENTAYIYFDFNLPVMTNTVSTLIDNYQPVTYAATENLLNVWPNPSNGDFMLACEMKNKGNVVVEVYDLLGKIVLNKQFEQTTDLQFRQEIHLNEEGAYIIRVRTLDDVFTARIIVTK